MVTIPLLLSRAPWARLAAVAALAATPVLLSSRPCVAQATEERATRPRRVEVGPDRPFLFRVGRDDDQRAVLGVSLAEGGRRDTLGVLVDDVTPDGPAAKAGLTDGARITAINGVSLRISSDDADDPALRGLGERRLRRELSKVTAGDEVELRVLDNGVARTVRVKTVAAEALEVTPARRVRESLEQRPYLGLSVGMSGSVRDTMGLFVSSVTDGGPAEQAGIIEGERIRSINGIDVRMPREDAGDWSMASARANRFTRTLRDAKPGDVITLEVASGGRTRTVKVTAGKASDFGGGARGFRMQIGDDGMFFSAPDGEPGRAVSPGTSVRGRIQRMGDDLELQLDGLSIDRDAMARSIGRAMEEVRRAMPRVELLREPGSVTFRGAPRLRRISL